MKRNLLPILECHRCHSELGWAFGDERQGDILAAEASCRACGSIYPVRDGIAAFLLPDPARVDLWETSASSLTTASTIWLASALGTTGHDRFVQVLISDPGVIQLMD